MSFCPSKDIHSIYIDNEMPDIYKAEYEAHLKNCPDCQRKLEKLRKLREIFNSDSTVVTPDEHYLDQSFERLQIKMKYLNNSDKKENKSIRKIKYFIPSVAAAAAVLLIAVTLPLSRAKVSSKDKVSELFDFNSKGNQPVMDAAYSNLSSKKQFFETTKDKYNSFNSGRTMVISGNIKEPSIGGVNSDYANAIPVKKSDNSGKVDVLINNYDVFRPDFGEEKISIRITVPGVDDLPVMTEIELPLEVVVGQH